jgi:hypothetical protein
MDLKLEYPDLDEAPLAQPTASNSNGGGRVEMEQAEIDAIIRNKRKARDPKACYACHRRKVKVSAVPVFVLVGARNVLMHFHPANLAQV